VRRRFVESRGFSADRDRLERAGELTMEDIVALEQDILANPEVGDLVPGTGGLRKVRARATPNSSRKSEAACACTTWTWARRT